MTAAQVWSLILNPAASAVLFWCDSCQKDRPKLCRREATDELALAPVETQTALWIMAQRMWPFTSKAWQHSCYLRAGGDIWLESSWMRTSGRSRDDNRSSDGTGRLSESCRAPSRACQWPGFRLGFCSARRTGSRLHMAAMGCCRRSCTT